MTDEEVRRQIGKGGDQLLPVFLSEEQNRSMGKEISKYKDDLYRREYLPQVKAFPQVRELFERIRRQGLRIALATSAKQDELAHNKRLANIEDLVEHESDKGDVKKSKPAPDVFAAALEKLGLDAEEAIAIGDTPYDAEAASKLHLRAVGFTCGGWSADALRAAGCIEVFRGPSDLLANFGKSSLDVGRAAA